MRNFYLFAILLLGVALPATSGQLHAQAYPFQGLGTVTAEVNVRSDVKEPVNNRLLSVNIGWDSGVFALDGYDNFRAKAFMRDFAPVSVRFPHGVWSNWYDWEEDKPVLRDDYEFGGFQEVIRGNVQYDWTFGFDGLKQLHDERDFDVLWTFSMLYNDATNKAVRRVRDHRAKGFAVTHVEMGNEHFWKDQRSNRLKEPADYLRACREMSAAFKRNNFGTKLSITTSWRRGEGTGRTANIDHTEYNRIIKGDGSHYDALTMHRYVNAGKGGTPTQDNYRTLLTSPLILEEDMRFMRSGVAANKEIWLTEWGVSGGYRAASYLGMADAYLYLFENQNIYKYANWFQIHGTNNFFRQTTSGNSLSTAKTGFGSTYEVLRGVFQDGTLLKTDVTTKTLRGNSKAVVARAVTRNGETQVLAVNKTNQRVKLTLKFNGAQYRGAFRHEAFAFNNLSQDIGDVPFDRNPLALLGQGNSSGENTLFLPPYSISVIKNITIPAPTGGQLIANGNYFLRNPNVGENLTATGGTVVMGGVNNRWVQQWTFDHLGNNVYTIRNRGNNRYLEVPNAGCGKGERVATWTGGGSAHQRWQVTLSGGKYFLRPSHCTSQAADRKPGPDKIVHTWNFSTGNVNQQWNIIRAGGASSRASNASGNELDAISNGGIRLNVFPNPVGTEDVTVRVVGAAEVGEINLTVHDITGREITRMTGGDRVLIPRAVFKTKGVYTVRVVVAGKEYQRRVVMQ
ncbi:RICIN domain-containing protein [Neolewinella antarctica]|uniref:Ricin B lectin domain-containing protein n=1 Tax=Neolewinella antarctica TaxID=442734 RepID=A0ABX0XGS5_9BACT|nr:RICIN domain-containing protein [Neolewinella antarctica]NJC28078.1 hypothetical protein [Neolewinella antarctica]